MRPPNYSNWPSIFWRTFFSRHPSKQRPSFSRHCPRSSCVWALYVALSSLALPLRQRIRPFTANKALWGPLCTVMGPFYPRGPPGRGVRGWSAPALAFVSKQSNISKLYLNSVSADDKAVRLRYDLG